MIRKNGRRGIFAELVCCTGLFVGGGSFSTHISGNRKGLQPLKSPSHDVRRNDVPQAR
jgi:hypothetical protein